MLAVLIVLLVRRRTWGRPVLFGLGAYLIALLPVLGFFNIYYHHISFVADHFQYLPLVGLSALCVHIAAWGLHRLGPISRARLTSLVLGVLLVTGCWFLSWQRAHVYRDMRTLCEDTLRRNPTSWSAHLRLGECLIEQERATRMQVADALGHFRRALELRPEHGPTLEAIGGALMRLGRPRDALAHLRRAVAAEPDNPAFHINLGSALEASRDLAGAIVEYKEAVRCGPGSFIPRIRLGRALFRTGQTEQGLEYLREAVDMRPDLAATHIALGTGLCAAGQFDDGIAHLREARRLDPDDRAAANALANAQRRRRMPSSQPSRPAP
jgi:tetratricopeptide (TPR) repeat protein